MLPEADKMDSNSSDCFASLRPYAITVVSLRCAIAIVNCVFLFGMICLMFLLKKYHDFTQRLILYLAISTFLLSFFNIFDVTSAVPLDNEPAVQYCILAGFVTQITNWWVILATACIMIDLFVKATFDKSTAKFEIVYIIFTFGFPFTFGWVPFLRSTFGSSSVYCWIKYYNDNCTRNRFGTVISLYVFYIPLYILMVFIIVMLVTALIFVRRKKTRWSGIYNPEAKRRQEMMVKEIYPLIGYPFIFIALNVPGIIKAIIAILSPEIGVYFVAAAIAALIYQFQGVAITLCFVLDAETRKNLKWNKLKFALMHCCSKEDFTRIQIHVVDGDSC